MHRDDRIGCVGCHKGDSRDPTVGAHARSMGFEPHPTHAEVPQICGNCHSDAAYMRHLNARLPVGQEALFRLSLHGKRTAAGDDQAPNCGSCHGRHEILPPSSPRSPVNRANVSKLCGGCHSDPKRMARYQIPTDQVSKWERSVHGQAFRNGNPNAPTCTGCHGAHASTPPDASSVARACGRCHEEEMGFFEQSPHSKGFRERGLAQCVACHGNHDVVSPTALIVGTTPDAICMKCHTQDEKPRKVAEETSGLLRDARGRAEAARAAVHRARDARPARRRDELRARSPRHRRAQAAGRGPHARSSPARGADRGARSRGRGEGREAHHRRRAGAPERAARVLPGAGPGGGGAVRQPGAEGAGARAAAALIRASGHGKPLRSARRSSCAAMCSAKGAGSTPASSARLVTAESRSDGL